MSAPADQIRWQMRVYMLLGQVLDRCAREDLPVIHWEVTTIGMLCGRSFHPDHPTRRAEVHAWARALDLKVWREIPDAGGTRLRAVRESVDGVDVVVLADMDFPQENPPARGDR